MLTRGDDVSMKKVIAFLLTLALLLLYVLPTQDTSILDPLQVKFIDVGQGDAILLQRNSHYHVPYWSLVAGFVDPGENFEEAVRREIREEASVEVRDIRYFSSQAWPFPSNMMVGFRAEYASGDLRPDGDEVIESGWFRRDALPPIPRPHSLARALIDAWVREAARQTSV